MCDYILQMKNITKNFDSVIANNDVSLHVKRGDIHAILGENGAGKSTLMNCLYGMYNDYNGTILFDGEHVKIEKTSQAIAFGIGMVHQHFMLVPTLTVIENLVLGVKRKNWILNLKSAANEFTNLCENYNMEIDPWMKVDRLSIVQQQKLELLKILYRRAKLLILDEPTAMLNQSEIDGLFIMMRQLKYEGYTIIFITHKLNEIMDICDKCTVLRSGAVVATVDIDQVQSKQQLATMMVGSENETEVIYRPVMLHDKKLEVRNLCIDNDKGISAVKGISFEVHGGETLGICGVDGNGQSELVQCITGLRKSVSGSFVINGVEATHYDSKRILDLGVSHIPEDRHKHGIIMDMTIDENLILVCYRKKCCSSRGFLNCKRIAEYSTKIIEKFNVKTLSVKELAKNLSGGNQQKLVVGRELERNSDLFIIAHPSRGLDIIARKYIQQQIIRKKNEATAILLFSADIDELIELSDRILVMYCGEIMEIVDSKNASRKILGALMAGLKN